MGCYFSKPQPQLEEANAANSQPTPPPTADPVEEVENKTDEVENKAVCEYHSNSRSLTTRDLSELSNHATHLSNSTSSRMFDLPDPSNLIPVPRDLVPTKASLTIHWERNQTFHRGANYHLVRENQNYAHGTELPPPYRSVHNYHPGTGHDPPEYQNWADDATSSVFGVPNPYGR